MTSRLLLRVAFVVGLLVCWTGCELIGPETDDDGADAGGLIVANQGNFGDANGSVMLYDPETQESELLAGELGSIVQSVFVHDGKIFVAANSADRVDVFDASTLGRVGQIDGVVSPRYFARAGENKLYVSNLFESNFQGGSVTILEPGALSVEGLIQVGDNPEGVTVHEGRAYVANHGFGAGRTISVIDVGTDMVVDTWTVDCDGPRWVYPDGDDDVYVFCTGRTLYDENFDEIGRTNGRVLVLDLSGSETRRFDMDDQILTSGPGQDVFYAERAELAYVVSGDAIHLFDTATDARRPPIQPEGDAPIGAVAFDAERGVLYIARVPGFVESGWVGIHSSTGAEIGRFQAGVAPAFISFLP